MQMPSLSELLSIFFDKKYDEKKKMVFLTKYFILPSLPLHPKKINKKKSLPSTHKNSFFSSLPWSILFFGLKRNGMKL